MPQRALARKPDGVAEDATWYEHIAQYLTTQGADEDEVGEVAAPMSRW